LTLECCRCHDHKYDPLSQRDYYQLFALFQNIQESGQTPHFTSPAPTPALSLPTPEQEKQIEKLRDTVHQKEQAFAQLVQEAEAKFKHWKGPTTEIPDTLIHLSFDQTNPWHNSLSNTIQAKPHDAPQLTDRLGGKCLTLTGENGVSITGLPAWGRGDPFTLTMQLNPKELASRQVIVHRSRAPIDAGSRGIELLLEDGRPTVGLHQMWPGDSIKVRSQRPIPTQAWSEVAVTYDGSGKASGIRIYLNGEQQPVEVLRDDLRRDIVGTGAELDLVIGYRFRDSGYRDGQIDNFRAFARALTPTEVCRIAGIKSEPNLQEFLSGYYEPSRAASDAIRIARRNLAAAQQSIREIMVMEEMSQPRPAFVLKRGAYDAPGETVTAGTPKVLPPFPADVPRNRLGLARWLTHPDHPLTARVTVNRLWQMMFGVGIVETADNFGTTGALPSHPELLDWLARDFIQHGWDQRHTLRLIALSETYQQSSRTTESIRTKDPYNRMLARFPIRRLSAEMLRDSALATSGLLAEKWGGPSVYPYQPEGLWLEALGRPQYPQSKGADLYRRSLYTFWKRTAPPPQLTIFDAADRSNCAVRRQTTSTPLQSLALLNDPQFVEAARFLGQKMLLEGGSTQEQRVRWGASNVLGRNVTPREVSILMQLWNEQTQHFQKHPEDAKKLLTVGDARCDPKLDPVELAAAASVALILFNHDEAVHCR
jgi:hypothetical protein